MLYSAARGLALFVGGLSLLNLVARLRWRAFDANRWWIDFGPVPVGIEVPIMVALAGLLVVWGLKPRGGPLRRGMTLGVVMAVGAVALYDAAAYYRLLARQSIHSSLPVPFSLLVVITLGWIGWAVARPARRLRLGGALAGVVACAIGFPLAQIACFGLTDYRRPADAIVVLGARAHADGTPSDALEDRVLTAIELYKQGLAPRLIFSGGPGDGALSEPQVMQNMAVARGVPAEAIVLDEGGLTTDATVQNAARMLGAPGRTVLAVSHAWHLPRVKLRCERQGLRAFTVPADERGQPLRQTPYLVLREVPALWLYWLRAVVID